jgi:hypothetical protein
VTFLQARSSQAQLRHTALRRLHKARIVIVGEATDAIGRRKAARN